MTKTFPPGITRTFSKFKSICVPSFHAIEIRFFVEFSFTSENFSVKNLIQWNFGGTCCVFPLLAEAKLAGAAY